MNILDHFTSIDDLLMSILERIGGVTEEDTHFFSYPNDGSRATITKGTTTLDFMSGTVMTPAGLVSNLGNSLRARGREYCRSLSLQADRDIIIQIGTKSKIPVFAGTWFKVAHLRFTDLKIIAAEDTQVFAIACTNPDSIEMVGESYVKDPVDVWGKTTTLGNAELAVRTHAPPLTFEQRGNVLRWEDFETATERCKITRTGSPTSARSNAVAKNGAFSYKIVVNILDKVYLSLPTNDFTLGRMGFSLAFSTVDAGFEVAAHLQYYTGTHLYLASVVHELPSGDIKIQSTGGLYTTIGNVQNYSDIHSFSTMKIVADLANGKYVRAIVRGEEFDISAYPLYSGADIGTRRVNGEVLVKHLAAGPNTMYVDNLILTENEPI